MTPTINHPDWCFDLPSPGIEHLKDYYIYHFSCVNCGHYNAIYVRKGVRVRDCNIRCANCGCEVEA